MNHIRIEIEPGSHVKALVDPFYAKNGSRGSARASDVFFLALEGLRLVGCVRYCVEEGIPLLRTMMIDEKLRRKKIGLMLLTEFAAYLDRNNIRNVFCLPYAHLDKFYSAVNFQKVDPTEIPPFLIDRMTIYKNAGNQNICMRRP